jgi:endonuclease/exonuclease/phosphatase (EEP) superfamily protein YafD
MENRKTAEFLELAEKQDADLILLAETDEFWCSSVKPLAAKYPYKVEVPLPNTYGLCLYSKLPLTQSEVKYLVEPDIPSIHTYVTLPSGQKIKLYCIHPEPPDLKKSTKDRDAELVIVAKEISTLNEPVIVAGDLNDVAWSSTTKLFGRLSKCNDPRVGRGLLNTFNARYLLFRWPLDHYFVSTHFTLNKIERLPFIGSDHFPIYISLTFDPTSQEENKQKEPSKRDLKKASEKLEDEKEGD